MESPQPRKRSLSHNDLNKDFIFLQKRIKNSHLSGDDTQCFQQVVEKESESKNQTLKGFNAALRSTACKSGIWFRSVPVHRKAALYIVFLTHVLIPLQNIVII